jgi:two-component system, LytTR family, sensor kinase
MQLFPNIHSIRFFALQNLGWLAFFLVHWLSSVAYGKGLSYGWLSLCIAMNGWLITFGLHKCYSRIWQREQKLRIARVLPWLVLAVLWMCLANAIAAPRLCHECTFNGLPGYLAYMGYIGYVLLSWTALWFGIKTMRAYEQAQRQAAEAISQANAAQLKMLRYQLNPHFLFNTLNAISTLTLERDFVRSEQMLSGLARFLRYTLEMEAKQRVSLAREAEMLSLYLNIESVRFSDRFEVRFEIPAELEQALIPSMLLQPLVENAIKHAVTKNERPCLLTLQASKLNRRLQLSIENNGIDPHAQNDQRHCAGVGLRNTAERLQTMYGDQHVFDYGTITADTFAVRIEIPLEIAEQVSGRLAA